MIACVTFETVKITGPVEDYGTDEVHLIHYVRDGNSESGKTYGDFYNEVCDRISEFWDGKNSSYRICEHRADVTDFRRMQEVVSAIIDRYNSKEAPCDIYINLSCGSAEYIIAATLESMMYDNTVPFTVGSKRYTVGTDRIRELYYREGRPVGLTSEVYPARALMKVPIDMPNRELVLSLRILDRLNGAYNDARSGQVISELKRTGLWRHAKKEGVPHETEVRTDLVRYHREYVRRWIDLGWAVKDEFRNRYYLTDKGRGVISTYYLEDTDDPTTQECLNFEREY